MKQRLNIIEDIDVKNFIVAGKIQWELSLDALKKTYEPPQKASEYFKNKIGGPHHRYEHKWTPE